jgi:hypothetical protein
MKLIHTNMGMYIIFMPLARRLMIVTKKLTAAASEATPRTCRPTVQKSMLSPGENCLLVRLAYPNHPPLGRGVDQPAGVQDQSPSRNTQ